MSGRFFNKIKFGNGLVLLVILFLIIGCSQGNKNGSDKNLTLIFSSDLMGRIRSCGCADADMGGLGRRVTYTEQMRDNYSNLVVLDAGDNFSLDFSFIKNAARLTIESFDFMGLDALTLGEKDFVFGLQFLLEVLSEVKFDVIATNIVDPESGNPIFGSSYKIITVPNGMKIAVAGVLDDKIEFAEYIDRSNFKVVPAEKSLRIIVPEMKINADLLILLSHLGLEGTKELAGKMNDFDLMIAGHGRTRTRGVEKIGNTLIVASGNNGQYLGRVDLKISPEMTVTEAKMKLIAMDDNIYIHPEIRRLFKKYDIALTDKELKGKH